MTWHIFLRKGPGLKKLSEIKPPLKFVLFCQVSHNQICIGGIQDSNMVVKMVFQQFLYIEKQLRLEMVQLDGEINHL